MAIDESAREGEQLKSVSGRVDRIVFEQGRSNLVLVEIVTGAGRSIKRYIDMALGLKGEVTVGRGKEVVDAGGLVNWYLSAADVSDVRVTLYPMDTLYGVSRRAEFTY